MQLVLNLDNRPQTLTEIHCQLQQHFGQQQLSSPTLDPVSQLVMGIISGRTQGEVYWSVFKELRRRFASWDDLRDAQVTEIENAISRVTHAEKKAPWLKKALEEITDACGQLSLDWLDDLTVDESLAWLERLPGVGRKVSAATLNFSTLCKPALVIDTHHLRILQRLGLIHPQSTLKQAYEEIMPLLPPEWSASDIDEHHQLVKTLGQTTCLHANPTCYSCPVRDLCPSNPGNSG